MHGANFIAQRYFSYRYQKIHHWKTHPIKCQKKILHNILQDIQGTEIGKKHHALSIKTYEEFKAHFPIVDYEDFTPYIKKTLSYKPDVLRRGKIKWFAKSSGTTSDKSKFIPVSQRFLKQGHYKAAQDVLASYLHYQKTNTILKGRGIIIGGSHGTDTSNSHIRFGDLSAVLIQNSAYWTRAFTSPSLPISLMDNWEEKVEKMGEYTIPQNITSISGVPTWTIVLIKHILKTTKKKHLIDVWPNLQLYVNGGVSFLPYKETMTNLIGKDIDYIEVYNASEGFFAAQQKKNDQEGMLLYTDHGTFYEFLPLEGLQDKKKAVSLESVEINKNYALIVSNYGGLIRYLIGDTIKFTSKNPYKIKITGRTRQFINSCGEEIIVDNTDNAIIKVCREFNVHIVDYTAAPIYATKSTKGRHEWIIQLNESLSKEQQKVFIKTLDKTLQGINSDYEAKRAGNLGLEIPIIHFTEEYIFEEWLKKKNKLGGQHKIPRLANDRKYIQEILADNKEGRIPN